MKTKNEDFTPHYVKIQNFILDNIHQGIYSPGDKIPSENELSQMFSVSRITANMAIKELSIMGVVNRQKGKGTFVCEPPNYQASAKILSPNLRLKPLVYKKHHLEQTTIIEAYPELTEKFHLDKQKLVYEIIRSVYANEKLTALDFSYIPIDITGYLPIQSDEITKTCLHEYLHNHSNCAPRYLEVYLDSPRFPFLKYDKAEFQDPEHLLFWSTDILDQNKRTIATTYTISPKEHNNDPFITFSIEF